jgi:hypothetical protein
MMQFWKSLYDEKVILCLMAFTFSVMAMVLIHWNADKDYVSIPWGLANMLIGALLRGITHQSGPNETTTSTTTSTSASPTPDK